MNISDFGLYLTDTFRRNTGVNGDSSEFLQSFSGCTFTSIIVYSVWLDQGLPGQRTPPFLSQRPPDDGPGSPGHPWGALGDDLSRADSTARTSETRRERGGYADRQRHVLSPTGSFHSGRSPCRLDAQFGG